MALLTKEQKEFRDAALLRNLRSAHGSAVAVYSDDKLVEIYNDFFLSEYSGNNDERFLEFIKDCVDAA